MQEILTRTYSVIDALKLSLQKGLTFAIYRLPAEDEITLVMQKDHQLRQLGSLSELPPDGGFLVAPFVGDNGDKTYIIRPDQIIRNSLTAAQYDDICSLDAPESLPIDHVAPAETRREEYIRQIYQTIERIRKGEYEKVVLSRVKIIRGSYYNELKRLFLMLSASYPNAFVYLFRFRGHCWMGATPEPLVCTKGDELFTVSLAGTRPYSEENLQLENWNRKELMEQEYVTRYIQNILTEFGIGEYSMTGPYAKKAGKLLHLRTDFRMSLGHIGNKLPLLISALHPTSAICGMPTEKSLQYIKEQEKHKREYYAGYLGPVGIDDYLQLFVNLRCMKVLENQVTLYVGGGITSDSVAEEEWEETEIKAETMLSILLQL